MKNDYDALKEINEILQKEFINFYQYKKKLKEDNKISFKSFKSDVVSNEKWENNNALTLKFYRNLSFFEENILIMKDL